MSSSDVGHSLFAKMTQRVVCCRLAQNLIDTQVSEYLKLYPNTAPPRRTMQRKFAEGEPGLRVPKPQSWHVPCTLAQPVLVQNSVPGLSCTDHIDACLTQP